MTTKKKGNYLQRNAELRKLRPVLCLRCFARVENLDHVVKIQAGKITYRYELHYLCEACFAKSTSNEKSVTGF